MSSFAAKAFPAGTRLARGLAAVLVLAVVAGVIAYLVTGPSTRTVKAEFSSAVGMYPGSDVRMLGVKVGTITSVTPHGTTVEIAMKVDEADKVPANAIATIVPPSLVSDRYVQLAPMYTGGPVLPDGATIPRNRTASPVELDDIYSALNRLNVALGPDGANKDGALSKLIATGAANLQGNGAALGQTLTNLSQAVSTLANSRDDLFGTVRNLQAFTLALQQSDAQVRQVNDLLQQVAGQLADERASLASALSNLSTALTSVAGFLAKNQDVFQKDVAGLKDVTGVLANKQAALNEILSVAPVALSNLAHTYNPSSGTLDTRTNAASLFNPAVICQALLDGGALHLVVATLAFLPGSVPTRLDGLCQAVLKAAPPTPTIPGLPGGLPPLPRIPGLPAATGSSAAKPGTATLPRIGLPSIPGVS